MQERHHVKTTPGEPHAVPEYTPHSVRKEEGGNVQMDDINIPIVAVAVAFFGVLLAVVIMWTAGVVLQLPGGRAGIRKLLAQDDPRTVLGAMLEKDRNELEVPGLRAGYESAGRGPCPPRRLRRRQRRRGSIGCPSIRR